MKVITILSLPIATVYQGSFVVLLTAQAQYMFCLFAAELKQTMRVLSTFQLLH
jgi:hypothetical protein